MKDRTLKQKLYIVFMGLVCLLCIGLVAVAVPSGALMDASAQTSKPKLLVEKTTPSSDYIFGQQAFKETYQEATAASLPMQSVLSMASTPSDELIDRDQLIEAQSQEDTMTNQASAGDENDTEKDAQQVKSTVSPPQDATNKEIIAQEVSDGLSITIYKVIEDSAVYEAAEIQVASASQLKTAFAQGKYGKSYRRYPSKIAADNQAVIAINADYCGFRTEGIVIRNGQLYRNKPSSKDLLMIDQNGDFFLMEEEQVDGEALLERGAIQTFSFGPSLVIDGEAQPAKKYFISKTVKEPRTAIGQIGPLHYLLVTVEGRSDDSDGMTLAELGQTMADWGCITAYNLDGGGTSTMIYRDEVINRVSGKAERASSDIIYFTGLSSSSEVNDGA